MTAVLLGVAGDTRGAFDRVADVYVPVAIFVFVAVAAALVITAVRGRRRTTALTRTSSTWLEIAYAAVLVLVAAGLATRTLTETAASNPVQPGTPAAGHPAVTIDVVASQWNWRFDYGGGVVQTGDGQGRFATLVVPADRLVQVRLTARDVIHAFWIPALRAKYDAIPGRANTFNLHFASGLDYSTARCSEFCGTYHDQMRFHVEVRSPQAFAVWLRERRERAAA